LGLFEFVSVMVSITLGLSLAQLLGGVAHLAHDVKKITRFFPHTIWVMSLLLVHSLVWWAAWDLHEVEWNYPRFVTVNCAPLILFFTSSLILPGKAKSGSIDLRAHFFKIRFLLMATFVALWTVWLLDGPIVFGSEALFIPFRVGQIAGLALVTWGMWTNKPRDHSLIAALVFVLILAAAVYRFLPGEFAPGA